MLTVEVVIAALPLLITLQQNTTDSGFLTQQFPVLIVTLLSLVLLFFLPLWRFVQWTTEVSWYAPAEIIWRSTARLVVWADNLRVLNILGLIFFPLALLVTLFTGTLDAQRLLQALDALFLTTGCWAGFRVFVLAPAWLRAVQTGEGGQAAAPVLDRLLHWQMLVAALGGVLTLVQDLLSPITGAEWLGDTVGLAGIVVIVLLLQATRRFVAATAGSAVPTA